MIRRLGLRYGTSLLGLLALLFCWTVFYRDGDLYWRLLRNLDGAPAAHPFGDLAAVLQAGVCWGRGVNVYAPNPCMHGGIFNYSPLLLRITDFGLGPWDTQPLAIALDVAFILSLSMLPAPANARAFWIRTAAALSGDTLFALERCNLDVSIFLLTLAGVSLALRGSLARLLGYAVFTLLAAVKFYPIALLVLAARERLLTGLALGAAGAVLLLLFFAHFGHGMAHAMRVIPHEYPLGGNFGAVNLAYGLDILFHPPHPTTVASILYYPLKPSLQQHVMVAQLVALVPALLLSGRYRAALAALQAAQQVLLVAGAAVIAGSFFAVQNIDYRGIFLLLTLPGLCAMAGRREAILCFCIVALMWEACLRRGVLNGFPPGGSFAGVPEILFWLLREMLWWWVAIHLLAVVLGFLRGEFKRLIEEF